ncbi:methylenetetrahydrofolate--tRNA-(uracil-5-)-methyltransferase TrmFO [Clostridia bacterium]|nr:methylenetetrahydrofolate--tRNA-(uracil-5-)-methyltransferase TrmFO [Clostridia bacterium]
MREILIIGGGLAGSEAALQLASSGIRVKLYDRKPSKVDGAYTLNGYAELVCNNSLGHVDENKPLGMLLRELKLNRSFLIDIAEKCKLQDDRYFAIDIKKFSALITEEIKKHPNITLIDEEVVKLPAMENIIIASGPLTHKRLADDISRTFKLKDYAFSDASSPIINIDDIDLSNSAIEKISNDLYYLKLNPQRFVEFTDRLKDGEIAGEHNSIDFVPDANTHPIEKLAREDISQLRAVRFAVSDNNLVIALRRAATLTNAFILVGCTTQLKNGSQVRAFSALPGFEKITADTFIRFGRMHKNTFFKTPHKLDNFFRVKQKQDVYLIGQISGLDGYAPAIASGLVAARRIIQGKNATQFPPTTMIGALARYVANSDPKDYNPMGAVMNLISHSNEWMLEPIWKNIVALVGEPFSTKRRSVFTYTLFDTETILIRVENSIKDTTYKVTKSDFAKVLNAMPIDGPGMINNLVWGPSYVYALLKDRRIMPWAV